MLCATILYFAQLWLYKLIQSRVLSHETSGGVGEPDMTSMTARSAAQPAEEDDGADDGDDFLLLTRRPGGSQSTKSSAPTPAANRTKSATSAVSLLLALYSTCFINGSVQTRGFSTE